MPRPFRRRFSWLVIGALVGLFAGTLHSAGAAITTCNGQNVTIVGTHGGCFRSDQKLRGIVPGL